MTPKLKIRHRKLKTKIIEDPEEILKYLHIGMSIPIRPSFYKYILNDINFFKANSIILIENDDVVGHSLLFNDTKDILYFGFFGVIDHDVDRINFLIDKIVDLGKSNNFKCIRGPINIPTIIYGWGFMKEGSCEDIFIGKPVNPPIYQEMFLKKDFFVKYEELSWEGKARRIYPSRIKKYDFSDYDYFNPKNLYEFMKLKNIFLKLHNKYLPISSRLTPNIGKIFGNYAEFIFEYGHNFMFFFIRYRPTKKIVACGAFLPDPFFKGKKRNSKALQIYTGVINPKHRRKGLALLMYGKTMIQAWEKNYRYGLASSGSDNISVQGLMRWYGARNTRSHLVLEYTF